VDPTEGFAINTAEIILIYLSHSRW